MWHITVINVMGADPVSAVFPKEREFSFSKIKQREIKEKCTFFPNLSFIVHKNTILQLMWNCSD